MGIRLNTNTWRAPLRLIDSWLPAVPASPRPVLPSALQRFARAGWLGRPTAPAVPAAMASPATGIRPRTPPAAGRTCPVRVPPTVDRIRTVHQGTRLVIAGRINDVCAELERLAALEHQHTAART